MERVKNNNYTSNSHFAKFNEAILFILEENNISHYMNILTCVL